MFMRYRGGGVGHRSTRDATDSFRKDRHRSDLPSKRVALDESSSDEESLSDDNVEPGMDFEGEGNQSEDSFIEELETEEVGEDSVYDEALETEEEECSDVPLEWPESDDEVEESEEVPDDSLGPEDGLGEGDEEEDFGYAAY